MNQYLLIEKIIKEYTRFLINNFAKYKDEFKEQEEKTLDVLQDINQKKLSKLQNIYEYKKEKKSTYNSSLTAQQNAEKWIRTIIRNSSCNPALRKVHKDLIKDDDYIEAVAKDLNSEYKSKIDREQEEDFIHNAQFYISVTKAISEIENFHLQGLNSKNYKSKKRAYDNDFVETDLYTSIKKPFQRQRAEIYHILERDLRFAEIDEVRIQKVYDFIKFNYDKNLIDGEEVKFKERGNDNYTLIGGYMGWKKIISSVHSKKQI